MKLSLLGLCALSLALSACDKKEEIKVVDTTPEAQATAPAEAPPQQEAATEDAGAPKVGQEMGQGDMVPASMDVLVDPGAEVPEPVTKAIAVLYPTKGSKVMGKVTFEKTDEGLKVVSTFTGLPPKSTHAHHIHLLGDCSSDNAKSADTHFHFKGSSLTPPPDIQYITGDLGNLEADAKGEASAEMVLKDADVQGKYSILGRSVIVHEKPNDPTQPPMGGAGERLSCGAIGITK